MHTAKNKLCYGHCVDLKSVSHTEYTMAIFEPTTGIHLSSYVQYNQIAGKCLI